LQLHPRDGKMRRTRSIGGVRETVSSFNLNRLLWFVAAVLSLAAAGLGVANPSLYKGVISESVEPGVFTQDIVAIVASIVLLLLVLTSRELQLRKRVVAHGLLGFFFYAYGIYAVERVYNWLYPIYLAIFGLSLFALIYGLATIPRKAADTIEVRSPIRQLGAGYAILIAVMFSILWLSQLMPLLRTGDRIEFTYSIYILDLSFVMPAFFLAGIMALRRHPLGLMGVPALFVLGVGILSPLALAELLKPVRYSLSSDMGGFWLYLVLSVVFLVFATVYLTGLKSRERSV